MKANSHPPRLLIMAYFKASSLPEVHPRIIPPGTIVVELITEGTVYYQQGAEDLKLGCGALFWHIPGEQTIYRTDADSPYECLAMSFSWPHLASRTVSRLSVIADHQRVRDLSSELLSSYFDDKIDREILAAYAYSRLLWEAHIGATLDVAPASINAALAFIRSDFSRPEVGVLDIARSSGISIPHIHALFRKHIGQPPHRYLTEFRIREAKWLLTRSHYAIKVIASKCGFLNIETFYRAFKSAVGISPHQFRKSNNLLILDEDSPSRNESLRRLTGQHTPHE